MQSAPGSCHHLLARTAAARLNVIPAALRTFGQPELQLGPEARHRETPMVPLCHPSWNYPRGQHCLVSAALLQCRSSPGLLLPCYALADPKLQDLTLS